jgi:hypothetical protein
MSDEPMSDEPKTDEPNEVPPAPEVPSDPGERPLNEPDGRTPEGIYRGVPPLLVDPSNSEVTEYGDLGSDRGVVS